MAYTSDSSSRCLVYSKGSTVGSAFFKQSIYDAKGIFTLNFLLTIFAFLDLLEIYFLFVYCWSCAIARFSTSCSQVDACILNGTVMCNTYLHRCWILLEQVKLSTMFFVMWCFLWVARQLFQRLAVANLSSCVHILGKVTFHEGNCVHLNGR